MSRGRKGSRVAALLKALQLPLKALTNLFIRMVRHMMRSFMANIVWFVTGILTTVILVRNLMLNLIQKLSFYSFLDAVKRFAVGIKNGFNHAIEAVLETPKLISHPVNSVKHGIQHGAMALYSPVAGFFEMLAVPVRGFTNALRVHGYTFIDTLYEDYKKLVSVEEKFRIKIKTDLTSASDRVNSSFTVLKDKVVYLFTSTYTEMSAFVSNTSQRTKEFVGITGEKAKEVVSIAGQKVKNFFGVFFIKAQTTAQTAKEYATGSAGVIAIKLQNVKETAYINVKNIHDTVRLGTYYIVDEGKKGFPSSRRKLVRGSLQIKDGIITNVQRVKLALVETYTFRFISGIISKRMEHLQNASAFDGAVVLGTLGAIAYLGYLVIDRQQRERYHRSLKIHDTIRDACKDMVLQEPTLRKCMDSLQHQMLLGLDPKTRDKSTVKCFNTFVQDLPTGQETGQFLALDLGGTNFRVLLITLNGRHFDMQSKIYVVPTHVMTGTGEDLFDHIASCLESFIREHKISDRCLPLGFTFSFPLQQFGLTKGVLQKWTKGFNCSGVVGEDVVRLLEIAIKKKHIKIDVLAVLNDTTGTLMSCAWKNRNCKIGVILGTGTNACYTEKVENVIGFNSLVDKQLVVINTEWGAFGEKGELDFIRTAYDKEIDRASINPGKQIHEKMISGMYLGELVRLLLIKFGNDKTIFNGELSELIKERNSFPTEFISEIESDKRGTFKNCRKVLGKLNMLNVTDQDCANVRYVCECVSRRAAHLASAGIATLINKMAIQSVTVGIDGSLYRYHPYFHDLMMEKIGQLVSPSVHLSLMLSEDGSGRGAALVVASSLNK